MPNGHLQIAYRDPDRTPLLYVIKHEAAVHEALDVSIDRVQPALDFEEGFLSGKLDIICEHGRFLPAARRAGPAVHVVGVAKTEERASIHAEKTQAVERGQLVEIQVESRPA